MPGPFAIVGLSSLATMVVELVKAIVSWLFTKGAKRVAFYTVFIGAVYLAINTFYSIVSGNLALLISGMPPIVGTIAYVFPSNTPACIGAIASVEVAGLAYTFAMKTIKIKMAVVD